ncbi:MAG: hypothetical protein SGJ21_08400 [Alphaproteobacteria bacterium]|nr:hypothetical protein [Alphaproteobacteria bacterium]
MAKADDAWSKLSRSKIRRFFARLKEDDLRYPEKIGLIVKFHFPINPYFLLYKHPDSNIRSTAWLTVLTSMFAIFMQLVYTQRPMNTDPSQTTLVRLEQKAVTPNRLSPPISPSN